MRLFVPCQLTVNVASNDDTSLVDTLRISGFLGPSLSPEHSVHRGLLRAPLTSVLTVAKAGLRRSGSTDGQINVLRNHNDPDTDIQSQ